MNSFNIIDILLVEDNINDAELTIRELKKHQIACHLVHMEDGEEALEFIFGTGRYAERQQPLNQPKLILLDIHMPKISGIDVLKKIKNNPATSSLPVVMLTSSNEDPDIQTCYTLGADNYVVKPVNYDDFSAAIKNIGIYWLLLNQYLT